MCKTTRFLNFLNIHDQHNTRKLESNFKCITGGTTESADHIEIRSTKSHEYVFDQHFKFTRMTANLMYRLCKTMVEIKMTAY